MTVRTVETDAAKTGLCSTWKHAPRLDRLAPAIKMQKEESMTNLKGLRLASAVTAIDVVVASGFSIAAIVAPHLLVASASGHTEASLILALYAAARTIPLALFSLIAISKRAVPALQLLGALAGTMQLLDAAIGLYERDVGKCAGPLFIGVLQFFATYRLYRSVGIAATTSPGS